MNANQVMEAIQFINDQYNSYHGMPPEMQPLVTWTDKQLLEIICTLIHRIDKLEREANHIRQGYSPSVEEL